jgi:hypothetical protein
MQGQDSLACQQRGGPLKSLTDTLVERVDELVQPPNERPLVWGNPLLSVTPTSMAVRELAVRTEALESAVRQIAFEVQEFLDQASSARGTARAQL